MSKEQTEEITDAELVPADEKEAVGLIGKAFAGAEAIVLPEHDPEAQQALIIGRLLRGGSLEDMFDVFEAPSIKVYANKVVTIDNVSWAAYDSDRGPVPQAHFTVQVRGEDTKKDCRATSPNITAFIYNAEKMGLIPFTARVVGDATDSGNEALHFGRV